MLFNCEYSSTDFTLTINIKEAKSNDITRESFPFSDGVTVELENSEETVKVLLERTPEFTHQDQDNLDICFKFDHSSNQDSYTAWIRLFIAPKEKILYAGFDFGSEASQMRDGIYDPLVNGIKQNDVSIFNNMKLAYQFSGENEGYVQYESHRLYKSVFYCKKTIDDQKFGDDKNNWIVPPSSLNILTPNSSKGPNFFNDWIQIPNLKLINGNPSIANKISFQVTSNGHTYHEDLSSITMGLYGGLLREILTNYLSRKITADTYLKFTLLVPNIYAKGEIDYTRKLIRNIVTNPSNKFAKRIKGLEISSLSESDAAFLGCLNDNTPDRDKYYLIIDCGKGTTDFSLLTLVTKNSYRSEYRNGFSGAGNLITFAFFQTVLQHLYSSNTVSDKGAFDDFYRQVIATGPQNIWKESFFQFAERWKANYDPKLTIEKVESEWADTKSEDLNFNNVFSKERPITDVIALLSQVKHVYDWYGFIEKAVQEISQRIYMNLSPVLERLNKKKKCGGVLFTGRGFLFNPLLQAAKISIETVRGLTGVNYIKVNDNKLKEICLDGIFAHKILEYNDISSTPIEITKGTLRQVRRSDFPAKHSFNQWFKKLDSISGEGEFYDEDINCCKILNLDFNECEFLLGGRRYRPRLSPDNLVEAILIQSRKGLVIKAKDEKGRSHIIYLDNVGNQNSNDQLMTEKSLFPGWCDAKIIQLIQDII